MQANWPVYQGPGDAEADAEMRWVIRLITEIRSVRSEMNVPAGAKIPGVLAHPNAESAAMTERWEAEISRLARLESLTIAEDVPSASAQIVLDEAVMALPLAGVIDFAAEDRRLNKELDKTNKDIAAIEGRLNNPGFAAKAPPEVIEEAKERRDDLTVRAGQVKEALARLAAIS
jgi:valyl-tRNA synthetase